MEQDVIIMQEIFRFKQLGHRPERPGVRPVRGDRRAADVREPAGAEGHQAAVATCSRSACCCEIESSVQSAVAECRSDRPIAS